MKLKDFLELYDNWNGIVKINDNNLNCIVKDKGYIIAESNNEKMMNGEVVSFGYYDGELCIRIEVK